MINSTQQVLSWRWNVPNVITLVRVILASVVFYLLIRGDAAEFRLAGILLVIAWITDWLDGMLARRLGQSTLGGALFDLVADRFLMTPVLIISVIVGIWQRTAGFMPFNPYPYAVIVVVADMTVLAGVLTYLWKRRTREMVFPTPTQIARVTYSVQMLALVVGVLGLFSDIILAVLMYIAIVFTLLAAYSYLKKGGYVFTS